MRVIIRADATRGLGTGHVMRCWALAEEFASRGAQVFWQSSLAVDWVYAAVRATQWQLLEPKGSAHHQALQAAALEADLVVVDSYSLEHRYRASLLERGVPVVAIVDDSQDDPGPGSLWVNPGVEVPWAPEPPGAFLNGPDYVLIRQAIKSLRTLREGTVERKGVGENLTFVLGGSDFAGLRAVVAGLASSSIPDARITAGPAAKSGQSGPVNWLGGGPDLLQQAAISRLVISPAGVSSWEMLHIGVPLALVLAAGNQRGNYDWMTGHGMALGLGSADELRNPANLIAAVTRAWEAVSERAPSAKTSIDGMGAKRVVDAAMALIRAT